MVASTQHPFPIIAYPWLLCCYVYISKPIQQNSCWFHLLSYNGSPSQLSWRVTWWSLVSQLPIHTLPPRCVTDSTRQIYLMWESSVSVLPVCRGLCLVLIFWYPMMSFLTCHGRTLWQFTLPLSHWLSWGEMQRLKQQKNNKRRPGTCKKCFDFSTFRISFWSHPSRMQLYPHVNASFPGCTSRWNKGAYGPCKKTLSNKKHTDFKWF